MAKLAIKAGWKLGRVQGSHHVFIIDGTFDKTAFRGLFKNLDRLKSMTYVSRFRLF